MSHLMKLNPRGLPESFDVERHGEKPMVEFDFKENIIEISYIFPGFTISHHPQDADDREGHGATIYKHEVGISGTGFFSESGKPLLPSFGRFVQIPPGYNYQLNYKKSGLKVIPDVKLKPAQENVTDQEAGVFEFNKDAYNEDEFYPEKAVECHGPLYMDAYRVICIHVRPMQYNPKKHLLHCYSNINVRITLLPEEISDGRGVDKEKIDKWVFLDRSKNLEGFGNFIFNPGRKFFERKTKLPSIDYIDAKREKTEFLIIYGKDFEKPAQELKEWKMKRGLETEIVSNQKIFEPEEDKVAKIKKIKQYIREKRRTPYSHLRYVLLFGDVGEIPNEQIRNSTTDHYYYTHRDAEEEECLLPWVSGGRIPARTESEGMSVVDQIIRYEKDPPGEKEYYQRMTMAAYFEDYGQDGEQDGRADKAFLKTMESIREHLISQDYNVNRVYVKNYKNPSRYSDGSPIPEEVKKAMIYKAHGKDATQKLIRYINKGQLIVGHRGHGQKWGWDNPPFKNDDLKKISSQMPSILFSINCLTGSFDWTKDCFAERILALDGGAPSLIASTEFSGTWRNDSMIKALYDAIWPGVLHTFPVTTMKYPIKYCRMGDILNYAKAYILVAHGFNINTQKHFEIYHVIGDPTLHIWGDEPIALVLRTYLVKDVLLINMNTCPRDAVLSVWYEGTRLIRLRPSVTRLAIPLMRFKEIREDALNPARDNTCSLSVCLAAPGHRIAISPVRF